jgi:hypothetical protein
MTKVIQFKREVEQEESCCPYCELVLDHIEGIAESESPQELFELLSQLVNEASHIGSEEFFDDGFEIGHKVGYKDALEDEVEIKQSIIREIEEDLDKDVAHCDCEECSLEN